MPDPSLKSIAEVAAEEADEAAYEAAWKAYIAAEPPREVPVVVIPGWRYDVQQQRWLGTATRLVKVRGGRGEEVLRQTFDVGAAPTLVFGRNALDHAHFVSARDDWKDLAYVKAQLPRLMDEALGAWLRPAFAEHLARRRHAAIDAHTADAGERRWLKYFFGLSSAEERMQLSPVEPGAERAFIGAPVVLAAGAQWRPRSPAARAVADEERLLSMRYAPVALDWHPSGERFLLTRYEGTEARRPDGELLPSLATGIAGEMLMLAHPRWTKRQRPYPGCAERRPSAAGVEAPSRFSLVPRRRDRPRPVNCAFPLFSYFPQRPETPEQRANHCAPACRGLTSTATPPRPPRPLLPSADGSPARVCRASRAPVPGWPLDRSEGRSAISRR